MKHNTLDHAQKCRIYGSLQQLFLPSVSDDLTPSPHASAEREGLIPLPQSEYKVRFFRDAGSLPSEWDHLLPDGQVVLSRAYLQVFAQNPPEDMDFAYMLFYKGHQAVGLACCQLMEFRALRQIQSLQEPADGKVRDRLLQGLKRSVARRINARLIVCGLTQFTGAFAYAFDPSSTPPLVQSRLLGAAISQLARQLKEEGWKPNAVLIKDFYAESLPQMEPLAEVGYSSTAFQPNMVLNLRPEWASFDDYLNAMSSKYRVRARRAFKKGKPIRRVELDAGGVSQHLNELHNLYQDVAAQADFNLLRLPAEYFLSMKQVFPEQFRVLAYFEQERLIGFCTTLRNGRELEAHFMGFRQEENRGYQLYLNMLYDMARLAIEKEKVEKLIFSRTAMEIKSSVGAEPIDMYCYLRHLYEPVNRLVPAIVRQLEPKVDWQQRHPFSQQED